MASDTGGSKDKGKPPERRAVSRARRHAEMQMEYNEKMHRLAMLRRRIELAQSGVRAFQEKRLTEAVKNFRSYIRILEDWKGVPEGKLTPANFDVTKDVAELLLISGVYWDMAKLYDRTRKAETLSEFRGYLEKYVMFSKGMPFQHVALETMRKYIGNDKPVHKAEFKNAYKMLGGDSTCFVATSLMDLCHPDTMPRLRGFRDERLARTAAGRAFVRWYYRNGPWMAGVADRCPRGVRLGMAWALDMVSWVLRESS